MTDLRETVARALYEHFVGEDFLNEYAPWDALGGKDEWLERADVVVAVPEITEALHRAWPEIYPTARTPDISAPPAEPVPN